MNIPSWWPFVLLVGASFSTWRLLAHDRILDWPRAKLTRLPIGWEEGDPIPEDFRQSLAEFVLCPRCLGFWCALAWWGAWQAWDEQTLTIGALMTIWASTALLARLDEGEE